MMEPIPAYTSDYMSQMVDQYVHPYVDYSSGVSLVDEYGTPKQEEQVMQEIAQAHLDAQILAAAQQAAQAGMNLVLAITPQGAMPMIIPADVPPPMGTLPVDINAALQIGQYDYMMAPPGFRATVWHWSG